MLAIRLARFGKSKQPTYRIIILEKTKDNYGNYLENLGHYNPRSKVCELNKDRILYWISRGAKPTPTVHNLLIDQNVIKAKKVKASKPGKKADQPSEAGKANEANTSSKASEGVKSENKPAEKETPESKSAESPNPSQ